MRHESHRVAAVVVVTTLAMLSTAVAQNLGERLSTAVKKIELGCAADVAQFCGTVSPGEGRLLFCIMAHDDKISRKCDLTLYDASRNLDRALGRIEQVAGACWADIEKSCAGAPEGGGRIMQCLASRGDLSPSCQASIRDVEVRSVGEAPAVK